MFTDNGSGSDSDTNTADSPEYYQPLSSAEEEEDEEEYHRDLTVQSLPNGYINCVENGVSALDLTDDDDDEEEENEEERMREAAIRRAIREDEMRRNAPLPAENATRVMEAMRGISFGGFTPNWAEQVPEDRWINELRRLRHSTSSTTTTST